MPEGGKMSKAAEYMLEVYMPGSADDVWMHFTSSAPFLPINIGDLLDPGIWPGSQSPTKILRVVNLKHIIWETDSHINHKLLVFTEEVGETREIGFTPTANS
jgi:hypothetical protein